MNIKEIEEQVKNNPLSKEECKAQFVEKTKELNLKHSFNFDEAWEIGQEIKKRNTFRNKITEFQENLSKSDLALSKEQLEKLNPVKHSFADGCYIREIFNPANELLVTKIHKKEHPFFLLKGEMSILTEDGIQHLSAPYHSITKPGTKRIIYTHTDCVFVTIHATNKTDIKEIEKDVIAENYNDPEISLQEIEKLTNKK
tara:strand:+ start:40 stop:636 length:597 start_codon:yes stop_codon:yes gene_type:complete